MFLVCSNGRVTWKSITLGHHAANFGGFKHGGAGDKTFSLCRVISKAHVF